MSTIKFWLLGDIKIANRDKEIWELNGYNLRSENIKALIDDFNESKNIEIVNDIDKIDYNNNDKLANKNEKKDKTNTNQKSKTRKSTEKEKSIEENVSQSQSEELFTDIKRNSLKIDKEIFKSIWIKYLDRKSGFISFITLPNMRNYRIKTTVADKTAFFVIKPKEVFDRIIYMDCTNNLEDYENDEGFICKDDKIFTFSDCMYNFGSQIVMKNSQTSETQSGLKSCRIKFKNHGNSKLSLNSSVFCPENTNKEKVFAIEPLNQALLPQEIGTFTLISNPRSPGKFVGTIKISGSGSPSILQFKTQCFGVQPKLSLNCSALNFEKILIHKEINKCFYISNEQNLALKYQLQNTEVLGGDFSWSSKEGLLEPNSRTKIELTFSPSHPSVYSKKVIRVDVLDPQIGLIENMSLAISAEAIDIAVDITFPKGLDTINTINTLSKENSSGSIQTSLGHIQFGLCRINEEMKHSAILKNRGKQEIEFCFRIDPKYKKYLSVHPKNGILPTNDRAQNVSFILKSPDEIKFEKLQIINCDLLESIKYSQPIINTANRKLNMQSNSDTTSDAQISQPSKQKIDEMQRNVIVSIPISASASCIPTKVIMHPQNDIDFGYIVKGSRKSQSFIIENVSCFDVKYQIIDPIQLSQLQSNSNRRNMPLLNGQNALRSPEDEQDSNNSINNDDSKSKLAMRKSTRITTNEQTYQTMTPIIVPPKFSIGKFTIFPTSGIITAGTSAVVNVECSLDSSQEICSEQRKFEESIKVCIFDRTSGHESLVNPNAIFDYSLIAENSEPSFSTDINQIFEKCCIFPNFSSKETIGHSKDIAVYLKAENTLILPKTRIDTTSCAEISIFNDSLVDATINLSLQKIDEASQGKNLLQSDNGLYSISDSKIQISPNQKHFVTINFTGTTSQTPAPIELSISTQANNYMKFKIKTICEIPSIKLLGIPSKVIDLGCTEYTNGILKGYIDILGVCDEVNIFPRFLIHSENERPCERGQQIEDNYHLQIIESNTNDKYETVKFGQVKRIYFSFQSHGYLGKIEAELLIEVEGNNFDRFSRKVLLKTVNSFEQIILKNLEKLDAIYFYDTIINLDTVRKNEEKNIVKRIINYSKSFTKTCKFKYDPKLLKIIPEEFTLKPEEDRVIDFTYYINELECRNVDERHFFLEYSVYGKDLDGNPKPLQSCQSSDNDLNVKKEEDSDQRLCEKYSITYEIDERDKIFLSKTNLTFKNVLIFQEYNDSISITNSTDKKLNIIAKIELYGEGEANSFASECVEYWKKIWMGSTGILEIAAYQSVKYNIRFKHSSTQFPNICIRFYDFSASTEMINCLEIQTMMSSNYSISLSNRNRIDYCIQKQIEDEKYINKFDHSLPTLLFTTTGLRRKMTDEINFHNLLASKVHIEINQCDSTKNNFQYERIHFDIDENSTRAIKFWYIPNYYDIEFCQLQVNISFKVDRNELRRITEYFNIAIDTQPPLVKCEPPILNLGENLLLGKSYFFTMNVDNLSGIEIPFTIKGIGQNKLSILSAEFTRNILKPFEKRKLKFQINSTDQISRLIDRKVQLFSNYLEDPIQMCINGKIKMTEIEVLIDSNKIYPSTITDIQLGSVEVGAKIEKLIKLVNSSNNDIKFTTSGSNNTLFANISNGSIEANSEAELTISCCPITYNKSNNFIGKIKLESQSKSWKFRIFAKCTPPIVKIYPSMFLNMGMTFLDPRKNMDIDWGNESIISNRTNLSSTFNRNNSNLDIFENETQSYQTAICYDNMNEKMERQIRIRNESDSFITIQLAQPIIQKHNGHIVANAAFRGGFSTIGKVQLAPKEELTKTVSFCGQHIGKYSVHIKLLINDLIEKILTLTAEVIRFKYCIEVEDEILIGSRLDLGKNACPIVLKFEKRLDVISAHKDAMKLICNKRMIESNNSTNITIDLDQNILNVGEFCTALLLYNYEILNIIGEIFSNEISLSKSRVFFGSISTGNSLIEYVDIYNPSLNVVYFEIIDTRKSKDENLKDEGYNIKFDPKSGSILPSNSLKISIQLKNVSQSGILRVNDFVFVFKNAVERQTKVRKPSISEILGAKSLKNLENCQNKCKLPIILVANCSERAVQKDAIFFNSAVFKSDKKQVPIANNSENEWTLYPRLLSSEQSETKNSPFTVQEKIEINARSQQNIPVIFSPISSIVGHDIDAGVQQQSSQNHFKDSLFVDLPSGQSLEYRLIGTVDPRKILSADKRTYEFNTFEFHKLFFKLLNPSSSIQKFSFDYEILKNDTHEILNVECSKTIQLGGKTEIEVPVSLYFKKVGQFTLRITFNSESCDEQIHILNCKVARSAIERKISVKGIVGEKKIFPLDLQYQIGEELEDNISALNTGAKRDQLLSQYKISCLNYDGYDQCEIQFQKDVDPSPVYRNDNHILCRYLPLQCGNFEAKLEVKGLYCDYLFDIDFEVKESCIGVLRKKLSCKFGRSVCCKLDFSHLLTKPRNDIRISIFDKNREKVYPQSISQPQSSPELTSSSSKASQLFQQPYNHPKSASNASSAPNSQYFGNLLVKKPILETLFNSNRLQTSTGNININEFDKQQQETIAPQSDHNVDFSRGTIEVHFEPSAKECSEEYIMRIEGAYVCPTEYIIECKTLGMHHPVELRSGAGEHRDGIIEIRRGQSRCLSVKNFTWKDLEFFAKIQNGSPFQITENRTMTGGSLVKAKQNFDVTIYVDNSQKTKPFDDTVIIGNELYSKKFYLRYLAN
ncbi:MAG: hypothetical protein MHMPM18_000208 [Marteilia pararefringens]